MDSPLYLLKLSRTPRSVFIAGCLMVAGGALAAPVTVLQDEISYTVNPDATYTYEEREQFRVNTTQGIAQIAQIPLLFSESLQKLEILEAYTTTRDGRRLEVTPDKIQLQQLPASTAAPTFSDHKLRVVIFPAVEVGATLTLHDRRTQLKPELPGVFSLRESFRRTDDFKSARLTLRAPATLQLQVHSSSIVGGEVNPPAPGVREWRWTLAESADIAPEPGSVDISDSSPYVEASNLQNYEELARRFMAGARPAAKITQDIRRQAEEITNGISDKRAQAEALYRWVSQNIRYVAILMDVGGYVPHAASEVLNARYGDCKDHVILLQALLAAKDITSSPALIDAGGSYALPQTAVLSAFNHSITYLPEYQLFVDSTPGFARFGVLSQSIRGKTALITDAMRGTSFLKQTPLISDQSDRIEVMTVAKLAEDGSIKGKNTVISAGVFELLHRATLANMPRQQLPQIAASLLARVGESGTGTLHFDNPWDLAQPFQFDASFEIPSYARLSNAGAFASTVGIGSPYGISSFLLGATAPQRTLPFPCPGGLREEVTEITLPANLDLTLLPTSMQTQTKAGSYQSTYTRRGNIVTARRRLDLSLPYATCSSADYREILKLANAVGQDLRSQFLHR